MVCGCLRERAGKTEGGRAMIPFNCRVPAADLPALGRTWITHVLYTTGDIAYPLRPRARSSAFDEHGMAA